MSKIYTVAEALEALDSMDDYARMDCGVDAHGPRNVLKSFIEQHMKPHDLYKTGDADAPNVIKDRNGEVVLGLCRRCGQAEADLEPMCPAA